MKSLKLIIYVFISFLVFSCAKSYNSKISNDKKHLELLKKEIISGNKILKFENITEFDWDNMIIITPYRSVKSIGKEYNIDLSSIEHFGIESRDDINLIVFLKNNKPIRAIEYPRYPGDFSNNEIELIKKSKAIFQIELTEEKSVNEKQWIRLNKITE